MRNIRESPIYKIAITGPESTGKSTLAAKLANHFKTVWIPEYAREYIDNLNRPYGYDDLEKILAGQLVREEEGLSKANRFLFCDTEPTVMKIWSSYKYGRVPDYIAEMCTSHMYDLYFLMNIDLPWVYDPQREHPEKRSFFFQWFQNELTLKNSPIFTISGRQEERFDAAASIINHQFLMR